MPAKQHSIAVLLIKLGAQANISMIIFAAILPPPTRKDKIQTQAQTRPRPDPAPEKAMGSETLHVPRGMVVDIRGHTYVHIRI